MAICVQICYHIFYVHLIFSMIASHPLTSYCFAKGSFPVICLNQHNQESTP